MSLNSNDWVLDDYSHVTSSMANSEYSSMSSDESNSPPFPSVYVNLGEKRLEKKMVSTAKSTNSCFDVPRFLRNLIEDIANLEKRFTQMTEDAMKENLEQTLIVMAIHSLVMKIRLEATVKDLECIVDKSYKVKEGPLEAEPKKKTATNMFVEETSRSNVGSRMQGRTVSCETESTLHKMTQFPLFTDFESDGYKTLHSMDDPILTGSHSFNMEANSHIKLVNTMGTVGPVIVKVYSEEDLVAERCLSDSEELEFGYDSKSDGSTVFRVYAAWRFDGLVEITAELYSGQGTENYGFWFRGDGLYRGDYENGQNLKLVKKWRP